MKRELEIDNCKCCHFRCVLTLGSGSIKYFCGYYEEWIEDSGDRVILPDWCNLKKVIVEDDNE